MCTALWRQLNQIKIYLSILRSLLNRLFYTLFMRLPTAPNAKNQARNSTGAFLEYRYHMFNNVVMAFV